MILVVDGSHDRDEVDADAELDRRRSELLDQEAEQLRGYAERLLATGSISIRRPDGTVSAQFRRPAWRYHGGGAWHRRPSLAIEGIPADNSGRHASRDGPMTSKYRDRDNLIWEITSQLDLGDHQPTQPLSRLARRRPVSRHDLFITSEVWLRQGLLVSSADLVFSVRRSPLVSPRRRRNCPSVAPQLTAERSSRCYGCCYYRAALRQFPDIRQDVAVRGPAAPPDAGPVSGLR
jgi:hypothetical protein